MSTPYEEMSDERLLLHIEWDSLAAKVWAERHGDKSIAEVLYDEPCEDQ